MSGVEENVCKPIREIYCKRISYERVYKDYKVIYDEEMAQGLMESEVLQSALCKLETLGSQGSSSNVIQRPESQGRRWYKSVFQSRVREDHHPSPIGGQKTKAVNLFCHFCCCCCSIQALHGLEYGYPH